jgi:hypothetical protein
MKTSPRFWIGSITATLWVGVGVYMLFNAPTQTWRLAGVLVVGVGILRFAMLLRQYRLLQGSSAADDDS